MKTIEAVIALMNHKRVRRPNWPEHLYLMVDPKKEEIRSFVNGKDCGLAKFSSDDLLADNWEIIRIEDLPYLDRSTTNEEFLC